MGRRLLAAALLHHSSIPSYVSCLPNLTPRDEAAEAATFLIPCAATSAALGKKMKLREKDEGRDCPADEIVSTQKSPLSPLLHTRRGEKKEKEDNNDILLP